MLVPSLRRNPAPAGHAPTAVLLSPPPAVPSFADFIADHRGLLLAPAVMEEIAEMAWWMQRLDDYVEAAV